VDINILMAAVIAQTIAEKMLEPLAAKKDKKLFKPEKFDTNRRFKQWSCTMINYLEMIKGQIRVPLAYAIRMGQANHSLTADTAYLRTIWSARMSAISVVIHECMRCTCVYRSAQQINY
jgi:hypothetical protein